MSELLLLLKSQEIERENLRFQCLHSNLVHRQYTGCVGRGTFYPREDIVCLNCGKKKIIYRSHDEVDMDVVKTIENQPGFLDQRITTIEYEYELLPRKGDK